ncbi:MAG: hypothetical protein IJM30_05610 [Thermoguttaceae bacterium]|nr:hypothetical protein [Thermoguttaceae bacterium]
MVAEIVSIGDEISTGAVLDTNSQFLSCSLSEIGARVLYHSTVSDDMDAMVAAFGLAFRRADIIVVTGGLGPTQDDLTRQAIANALGVELVFDQESLKRVESFFANRNRAMPESNKIQAYFPDGSRIITNPNGTAPGFIVERSRDDLPNRPSFVSSYPKRKGSFILESFPGVPAELKEMWSGANGRDAIVQFIDRATGGRKTYYKNKLIHAFGAGESAIEEKLPNLISRDHSPLVGITAKNSVITLRIFAEGASVEECDEQIDDISRFIYARVGDFIFGEDSDTLPGTVSQSLRAQCQRVGVFEWGTRGSLAQSIDPDVLAFGRVFGESERDDFIELFGDSSTVSESKKRLSDNRETFGSKFYVEEPISRELWALCETERRGGSLDYLLAVGPFPNSDSNEKTDVDVAFVDFRDRDKPILRRETFAFGGHPAIRATLFGNQALDLVRRYQ